MKGKIIVIEGTDGCGKKTQAGLLAENLNKTGKRAMVFSFPNYDNLSSGPVRLYLGGELSDNAKEIDAYQASVLYAVDRFCSMKQLRKFYEDGGILILDRYVQSNMIHQAGKIADVAEREKFLDWLNKFEFEMFKLPEADKVIFLKVPVEISMKLANSRINLKANTKKDIHENDENHLREAFDAAVYVAKKYSWDIVDCLDENKNLKTIEDIQEIVFKKVTELF